MSLATEHKRELLANVDLFRGVDPGHLDRIAETTVEVSFPSGHQIVREGDIGTGFFVVVDGRVDVVRDGEVIARLGPGEFFGELSVLDGGPRIAQVVAEEPTTCLALAGWDLEALLLAEPALALALLRRLARRLRSVSEDARH